MRILLTVGDGPALVWNGTSVHAPLDFVASLLPGTTLFAECSYGSRGLALSAEPNAEFTFVPTMPEAGVASLIATAQFDAALRVLDRIPQTADVLAFRARALIERHLDYETRTSEDESDDLAAGAVALKASLAAGGPQVAIDAVNSPWSCWTRLSRRETQPLGFSLGVELLRWVWKAIPRSPLERLAQFTPFAALLEHTPASEWPRAPWLAWGLAPQHVDTAGFAEAMGERLERRHPEDGDVQTFVRALRKGARPPKGVRAGRGATGLLAGLQVAMHSSRPNSVVTIALKATHGMPPAERLEWFPMLNDALAIGEVMGAFGRQRPSSPIERVLFRAIDDRYDVSPSISLLATGRLLAVFTHVIGGKKRVTLLEGGVDEVVAAMPDAHFPTAVVAVREGLAE
ncbi:MAG: hypothetical protein Q8S33_31855 [Myxococcales bacterium]|nr:hypothetical protein [Myxococcales bacterium]MDP3504976.1 hypothetical protein [Myxococcales bacterium]